MNPDPNNNLIVYNASAGSGKTFTLALEYISICLSEPLPRSFRKILAITFTNKAAHELKERILLFTQMLGAGAADKAMLDGIQERTGLSHDVIEVRAKASHRSMLYHYSDLHISTIDSFVLSILRAFSKELGKSFDFDVELDHEKVMDMMVESILSQVGIDHYITEQLAQLVTQNLDEGKSWNPKGSMNKALSHLMNEDSIPYRKELAKLGEEELRKQLSKLDKSRNELWQLIQSTQASVRDELRVGGLVESDFHRGASGFISFAFKNFKKKKPPTPKQIEHIADKSLESPAARKAGRTDDIEALRDYLKESVDVIMKALDALALVDNLHKNKISLILALRLHNLLQKLETEEGMSFLQDNNHKISDLIKDNPTPFIYERVGERFHHFLIDEFQDTSILQWRNMLPLIDGSLSYARKNFLVGDAKQSIYRWRGGEVDQMVELPQIPGSEKHPYLRQIEEVFKRNLIKKELGTNYRSSKAVIKFNNELFPKLSTQLSEKYRPSYKDVRQETHRSGTEGYVSMKRLEDKTSLEDCLEEVLKIIKQCEQDGYYGKDICLLSRSNKDGRVLAKFLEQEGYSVSSPDSLLLSGHADIQLLMSFIEVLSGGEAHRPFLYILHRLLERTDRLSEYNAWSGKLNNKKSGRSALIALISDLQISMDLDDFQDKDAYQSLQALTQILALSDKDPYLQELFNHAIGYCQGSESTLVGFLNYWNDRKSSICVKAGVSRKSIQVMTIHKSKGLQFPVVIIPLVRWKSGRFTKKKEWVRMNGTTLDIGLMDIKGDLVRTDYADVLNQEKQRTDLDNLNMFYVACTRAEDRMYINVSDPGFGGFAKDLAGHVSNTSENNIIEQGQEKQRTAQSEDLIRTPEIKGYERGTREDLLSVALSKEDSNRTQRDFGKSVHRVLEHARTEEEIPSRVDEFMPSDMCPEEERSHVLKASRTAFKIEKKEGWHELGLDERSEVEVMDSEGNTYRIDKLYLDNASGKMIIVDYKTGMRAEKDLRQMQGYKELMKNMGWKDIEAFLIYTESGEMEAV